jgi:hypothetical protein
MTVTEQHFLILSSGFAVAFRWPLFTAETSRKFVLDLTKFVCVA